jgi:hypothetical protein
MTTLPHVLLLALCLGCMRSPLPVDQAPRPSAPPAGTRPGVPLESVALAGPGLRGLELARLAERPLVVTPSPVAAPALAEAAPVPDVVDKSRQRRTDPAPPPPREEPVQERRPFLRPAVPPGGPAQTASALADPAAPTPAASVRDATPSQPQRAPGQTDLQARAAKPEPPGQSATAGPAKPVEPPPAPEREILAAAELPGGADPPRVTTLPAVPARQEAAPAAAAPASRSWDTDKRPVPPAPPALEVAERSPARMDPLGGSSASQVAEEAEAEAPVRPNRPTAAPDARFQVQIMSASDPEGAEDMRLQAELVFPDEVVEVVWDPPYYKVRVGAAATQEAAVELKRRALRLGFQNAWVVPRRQP